MRRVYTVETLYAAVVDAYVDWQTAIVEAVLRASLPGDQAVHFLGHERCVSALASPRQFTNAYRQGRGWSCECRCRRLPGGLRNYLAHQWTRDESFAISGGQWRQGSVWTRQRNATPDANPRLLPVLRAAGERRRREPGADAAQEEVRRGGPPARRRRRLRISCPSSTATCRACPPTAPGGVPRLRCRSPTAWSTATRALRSSNGLRRCRGPRPGAGRARSASSPRLGTETWNHFRAG